MLANGVSAGQVMITMCPRGDLNPETGEISPDRGNHAIKVTRAGLARTNILRGVRLVCSAWPVHGRGGRRGTSQHRGWPRDRRARALRDAQQLGSALAHAATFRDERGDAHAQVTAVISSPICAAAFACRSAVSTAPNKLICTAEDLQRCARRSNAS